MSTLDPTNESLYDRIDELRAEVAELRATIEARDEALMQAGRDNLRMGNELGRVYAAANVEITDEWTEADALRRIRDVLDADAVPASPRRAETTAELDALPVGAIVLDSDEIGPPPFVHVGPDVWWIVDHEMYSDRCDFQTIDIVRPATVLYMPPADGEGER